MKPFVGFEFLALCLKVEYLCSEFPLEFQESLGVVPTVPASFYPVGYWPGHLLKLGVRYQFDQNISASLCHSAFSHGVVNPQSMTVCDFRPAQSFLTRSALSRLPLDSRNLQASAA